MNVSQKVETEVIFLAIDNQTTFDDDIKFRWISHFFEKKPIQYAYLYWLLHRWTRLRKHKYELPR